MKKLLFALVAVLVTATSYGQGALVFNTRLAGSVDAPVTLADTGNGPGPTYSAQLFLVGSGGSLTAIPSSLTTFRAPGTGAAAALSKYVNPVDVTVPGVASGGSATLRMVAWQTAAGATYDAAFAANPNQTGRSSDITITLGGDTLPPANLTGLTGFVIPVPEPTTLALGALGAAALLFRRRK